MMVTRSHSLRVPHCWMWTKGLPRLTAPRTTLRSFRQRQGNPTIWSTYLDQDSALLGRLCCTCQFCGARSLIRMTKQPSKRQMIEMSMSAVKYGGSTHYTDQANILCAGSSTCARSARLDSNIRQTGPGPRASMRSQSDQCKG
jgi:hypothetical protein